MTKREKHEQDYYKNLCEQLSYRIQLLEKMMKKKVNEAKSKKKLDPVGKEDADIDNDGRPNTKTDQYLKNRRMAIKKAINKKKKPLAEGSMITDGRLSFGGFPRILNENSSLNNKN